LAAVELYLQEAVATVAMAVTMADGGGRSSRICKLFRSKYDNIDMNIVAYWISVQRGG
jgi:hypothetical protein